MQDNSIKLRNIFSKASHYCKMHYYTLTVYNSIHYFFDTSAEEHLRAKRPWNWALFCCIKFIPGKIPFYIEFSFLYQCLIWNSHHRNKGCGCAAVTIRKNNSEQKNLIEIREWAGLYTLPLNDRAIKENGHPGYIHRLEVQVPINSFIASEIVFHSIQIENASKSISNKSHMNNS